MNCSIQWLFLGLCSRCACCCLHLCVLVLRCCFQSLLSCEMQRSKVARGEPGASTWYEELHAKAVEVARHLGRCLLLRKVAVGDQWDLRCGRDGNGEAWAPRVQRALEAMAEAADGLPDAVFTHQAGSMQVAESPPWQLGAVAERLGVDKDRVLEALRGMPRWLELQQLEVQRREPLRRELSQLLDERRAAQRARDRGGLTEQQLAEADLAERQREQRVQELRQQKRSAPPADQAMHDLCGALQAELALYCHMVQLHYCCAWPVLRTACVAAAAAQGHVLLNGYIWEKPNARPWRVWYMPEEGVVDSEGVPVEFWRWASEAGLRVATDTDPRSLLALLGVEGRVLRPVHGPPPFGKKLQDTHGHASAERAGKFTLHLVDEGEEARRLALTAREKAKLRLAREEHCDERWSNVLLASTVPLMGAMTRRQAGTGWSGPDQHALDSAMMVRVQYHRPGPGLSEWVGLLPPAVALPLVTDPRVVHQLPYWEALLRPVLAVGALEGKEGAIAWQLPEVLDAEVAAQAEGKLAHKGRRVAEGQDSRARTRLKKMSGMACLSAFADILHLLACSLSVVDVICFRSVLFRFLCACFGSYVFRNRWSGCLVIGI